MEHMHINNELVSTGLSISTAYSVSTFFFISGFLFNDTAVYNAKEYISHKLRSLLLPYFTLSILFTFLDPRLYDISLLKYDPIVSLHYFPGIVLSNVFCGTIDYFMNAFGWIFLAGRSTPCTMPMWFVLSLFFASSIFSWFFLTFNRSKTIIALSSCIALMGGWLLSIYDVLLVFNLSSVLTAYFFYSLGFLAKPIVSIIQGIKTINLIVCLFVLSLLYLIGININGAVNLISNSLGPDFGGYLMSTGSGIALLICAFVLFSRIKFKLFGGILRNIARNGIIVLAVHYWLLRICFEFIDRDYIVGGVHYISFYSIGFVVMGTILTIPIFRNKLYWLIGTRKVSVKESLSVM